jgi:protoporphyrinogen oxidase
MLVNRNITQSKKKYRCKNGNRRNKYKIGIVIYFITCSSLPFAGFIRLIKRFRMQSHYKYVIIGAGPTGLGAAYRLKELEENNFIVLEKEAVAGGLSRSFTDEKGFLWDVGGHVQFSHYDYFDRLMIKALGKEGWLNHQRESWVWMKNRFIPYPFQNNIRYLPKESMWKCLEGIISLYKNPFPQAPANFHDWILATFGAGIAEEFMIPYNFKVWAHPAEEMSYQWVGERVAIADLDRVTHNIVFNKDDFSWGPNNLFQFPKTGGTGSIWESVEKMIGPEYFSLNTGVTRIEEDTQKIHLSNGALITYDYLLSSVPLDLLTKMITNPPDIISDAAKKLRFSSTNIVGIGLSGKPKAELATKCWMYFPENNSPYYRVTVFSNYSPGNVPDHKHCWSLMTETSESIHKPVDRHNLIERVIKGLLEDQLIETENDILSKFIFSVDHGYPVPFVGRDAVLGTILPWLEQKNIYSRGRFGAWKYEVSNQDHSLMQGVEWANKMKLGINEVTVHFPETANKNWGRK